MNPKNYEHWQDPDGGYWIKIKRGDAKGIIWRPTDLEMVGDDGQIRFQVEMFEGPGIPPLTDENGPAFQKAAQSCILNILSNEAAELQTIAEEADKQNVETNALKKHLSEQEVLKGGHQVSEALLPQDIQSDLAQISSVLGGLKPQ